MARGLLGALWATALFATALIGPSRDWDWRAAWVLVGLYLIIHLVGTVRIVRANPTLLEERAKLPVQRGQPLLDKVLLLAIMATYAAELVVTGLDHRYGHPLAPRSVVVAGLGLTLFALGWVLVMLALETNAYAVTVVRHQSERGHTLVSRGVYGVVRHPMYAGLVAALLGVPLWLGSPIGMVAAVVPIGLLVLRILLEERVLARALPDYAAYTARVRSRLLPGLW